MKTLQLLIVITFLPLLSYTQPFQYLYGGDGADFGHDVVKTPDGNYVIVGTTSSFFDNVDVLLLKIDTLGNILWSKTYSSGFLEDGVSIDNTQDGGLIILGNAESKENYIDKPFFVFKTDKDGKVEWSRSFDGSFSDTIPTFRTYGAAIYTCSSNGYIAAGSIYINDTLGTTYFTKLVLYLVRIDTNGNSIWEKYYNVPSYFNDIVPEGNQCITQTSDHGFLVTATIWNNQFGYNNRMLIIKADSLGDTMWTKIVARSDGGALYSGEGVFKTLDNNYIILGSSGIDIFIKLMESGDTIWTKYYNGNSGGYSMFNIQDSSFLFLGYTTEGIELLKFDKAGNILLMRQFGNTEKGIIRYNLGSSLNNNSTFLLTGSKVNYRYTRSWDIYTLKMNIDDSLECNDYPLNINQANVALNFTSGVKASDINISKPISFSVTNRTLHQLNACDTVDGVNELPITKLSFSSFYNHASATIEIQSPFTVTKEITLWLYSTSGQLIKKENASILTSYSWNIKDLPRGLYFIRVTALNIHYKNKILKL